MTPVDVGNTFRASHPIASAPHSHVCTALATPLARGVVGAPAAAQDRSETISTMSGLPNFLMPHVTPAGRKPARTVTERVESLCMTNL